MNKLVSIVVPVYNVEKYLRECLDSIISQTYEELEIILVDDGSFDSCGEICDEYSQIDARIKVIHQENAGLSEARNVGIRNSCGHYIYFCDSDDYLNKYTIEKLMNSVEISDADCVFFDAEVFSNEGIEFRENSYTRNLQYNVGEGIKVGFKQLIFDEYIPCVPLHFYKKEFLDEYFIRFKKGIIGEDELFSFYVYLNANKVDYISEKLYYRRMREGSIMTTKGKSIKKFQSYVEILCDMEKCLEKVDGLQEKFCKEYMDRIAKSTLLVYKNLTEDEKKLVSDSYKKIKSMIYHYKGLGDPSLIVRMYFWNIGVLISGIRKYTRMKLYGKRKSNICN